MKQTSKMRSSRSEFSTSFGKFAGANWSAPAESLPANVWRELRNVRLHGNRLVNRPGSAPVSFEHEEIPCSAVSAVAWEVDHSIQIVVIHGDDDYFWWQRVGEDYKTWAQVSSRSVLLQRSQLYPAHMVASGGKLYVFHRDGNQIFEFKDGLVKGRPMGYSAPVIQGATFTSGVLYGVYAYGVELVKLDGNVVVLSSGIHRSIDNKAMCSNSSVRIQCKSTDEDDVALTTNPDWTHARLWRTKEMNSAVGSIDEMYLVQKIDRSSFVTGVYGPYTFNWDNIADSMLDDTTLATIDDMDLRPIPAGNIGHLHHDRIWVGQCASLDATLGNLYYANIPGNRFEELYKPIVNCVPCKSGDGQTVTGLYTVDGDLIVARSGSTGRIMAGDPLNGFEVIDQLVGVEKQQHGVELPGYGIAARCNDGQFRVLTRALNWSQTLGGVDISDPVDGKFDSNIVACGFSDRILVGAQGFVWTLQLSGAVGWVVDEYVHSYTNIVLLFPYLNTNEVGLLRNFQPLVRINVDYNDTDIRYNAGEYSVYPITATMETPCVRGDAGSFSELWDVLVFGAFKERLFAQAVVNGRAWLSSEPFIQNPGIGNEWNENAAQSYQWLPNGTRPIGRTVRLILKATGRFALHSVSMRGYNQTGVANPDWDPFSILDYGLLTELNTLNHLVRLTRPNMLVDQSLSMASVEVDDG